MRRRGHRSTWTATWLHHRGVASIESVTWLRRELDNWVRAVGVSTLGKDDITVTVSGRGLALIRRPSDGMDLRHGEYGATVDMRWRRT